MTGDKLIESLNAETMAHQKGIAELELIKTLKIEFPDLTKDVNRWGKVRYSSSSVNAKADQCDIYHSCGCCNDAPLFVSPYFVHSSGFKIYTLPEKFFIGEKNEYGYGDCPDKDWKEKLKAANCHESIFKQVADYFEENPEQHNYSDDDTSNQD